MMAMEAGSTIKCSEKINHLLNLKKNKIDTTNQPTIGLIFFHKKDGIFLA